MLRLKTIFNPNSYFRFVQTRLQEGRLRLQPNLRGAVYYPPGHFYSPLLDIQQLGPNDSNLPFDGAEWWEHVNLRPGEQRSYYEDLLDRFPVLPFPRQKTESYRYFIENAMFPLSDAFTLSGIIRREKPRRIVEVGSGFSSAVMLDTLDQTHESVALTFIEPYPDRLYSLLSPHDRSIATVIVRRVQEVSLSVFDQLEAQDLVFIDSSHVSKIGSDVTFILLRILPRLKRGVLVQFHDIFYPFSYPVHWIRQGRAWNESLFLRAFLVGNPEFQLVAFNPYVGYLFPDVFRDRFPAFLNNTGGSLWIRKVA
ncbi:MAG TPA: class I SAM-dependent methyltransferase [Terriglobia bacterium]|nr:class I SAM-dependent methyltransferase [Terriglobia bacterium]